jgi:hypothetical protein
VKARADGGMHTADNLLTLCSAHHRAIHRGELIVVGTPSTGLCFQHADGTSYGGSRSAVSTGARARAARALTRLGFSETQTQHALAQVPCNPTASLEDIVRQALLKLARA